MNHIRRRERGEAGRGGAGQGGDFHILQKKQFGIARIFMVQDLSLECKLFGYNNYRTYYAQKSII